MIYWIKEKKEFCMRQETHVFDDKKKTRTDTINRIRTSIEAHKFIIKLRRAIKTKYGKRYIF